MPKCKVCGLIAKAVSDDGYCMLCFMQEIQKHNPDVIFTGDIIKQFDGVKGA